MNLTDKDKRLLGRMKTPLAPRKGDWDLAAALIERLANECKESRGKALREAANLFHQYSGDHARILALIGFPND